jgi:hypothetical protein
VVTTLPATGAGVSLLEGGLSGGSIAGSSRWAFELEDLQFSLGEGPCADAASGRRPVLEPDLGRPAFSRWPAYAPEAFVRGVRGVFAFPLQMGSACLGALDVYQDRTGPLPGKALTLALRFADLAVEILLEAQARNGAGNTAETVPDIVSPRMEVYQAQGMLMVDLGVNLDEAMSRLRAHAYSEGLTLGEVAREVVAGNLRLQP